MAFAMEQPAVSDFQIHAIWLSFKKTEFVPTGQSWPYSKASEGVGSLTLDASERIIQEFPPNQLIIRSH